MAVLGAQVVITLVMMVVIQKLSPYTSFAQYILCKTGLLRYLHPTDDELRKKAGVPKDKPHKRKPHERNGGGVVSNGNAPEHNNNSNKFHVPCSLELVLETTPVVPRDVVHLRYYVEYQWLVDFSLYAGILYLISECYHFFVPLKNELNLSMVWCLLVIFFAIKILCSLTVLYFKSEESIGERSMIIVSCLLYLVIAMMVLIVDERTLETGLESAYDSFNASASAFLNQQGLQSTGPASKLIVKLFIALCCGLLGSLYTFPGLRMAKMHWDSLKAYAGNTLMQLLLHFSFMMPLLLVVLWIKPISRDLLTERIFQGRTEPLLTPTTFESLRLLLTVLVVALRLALMPVYLQSYLNIAYNKMTELRCQAGRITNIELQKKISSIFYYLCVVTLQFVAPLVLCLYLTFMYKSLGGFSWSACFISQQSQEPAAGQGVCAAVPALSTDNGYCTTAPNAAEDFHEFEETSEAEAEALDFSILQTATTLQASITSLKNVFTVEVYRGLLGFAAWWSYFTLFATSAIGILYQSYFARA